MRVLGIDCGSEFTGFGVVELGDGRALRCVAAGVIRLPVREGLPRKLERIFQELSVVIVEHRPDMVAIEDVFHAANTRTALVLGHVRGVVLLAGAQAGLPVHEFPPAAVKQQITGFGRAEKGQVAFMVARMLGLAGKGEAGDASDALAVALCHAHLTRTGGTAS